MPNATWRRRGVATASRGVSPPLQRSRAEWKGRSASGGLHKRSAEDWGHGLRARGAELPLGGLAVALGSALRAGTGPQRWVANDGRSWQEAGRRLPPLE